MNTAVISTVAAVVVSVLLAAGAMHFSDPNTQQDPVEFKRDAEFDGAADGPGISYDETSGGPTAGLGVDLGAQGRVAAPMPAGVEMPSELTGIVN